MNQKKTTLGRLSAAAVLVAGTGLLGLSPTGAQGQDGERIEATRGTLQKWFEARQLLSKERREWLLGRETLLARIGVVESEIEQLKGKLAEARKSITDADQKRSQLAREAERREQASAGLAAAITRLEEQTSTLLARLPDPIRERVRPLSQRLPQDSASTKLTLAERFPTVVGILNEVDKWNREITVASEVRALPDGTSAEVTTLYLGLGQGYYVSTNEAHAGTGTATATSWVWTPANYAAPAIAHVARILANEDVAGFVRLPLEIR
jgi:hypothetical protein